MQRIEAWFQGEWWSQGKYVRCIFSITSDWYPLYKRGEIIQQQQDRGSSPKRRMALCHWCQRGRDNHIDVIDVYWWERLIWRDIHIDYWCRACLVYMLTSIFCNWCLVIGVDINVSISINAKGGDCWIMLSLMPMVCHWCQWFDYLGDCWIICHWCKWFGLIDVIGWCQVIDLYDSLDENVICPSGNQSMQNKWMNSKVVPLWWKSSREDSLRIELS